ncbi:MAG: adenylyltransferase/cytidyltransferase family protein [Kiritimatiellae bacterium]|nr:adenylyltransferase/cytidyltransferase family protein [Kiritimatiellia bacterium]
MRKVVTYGTFDCLHEGHRRLLERAKAPGGWLIVGVTTAATTGWLGQRTAGWLLGGPAEHVPRGGRGLRQTYCFFPTKRIERTPDTGYSQVRDLFMQVVIPHVNENEMRYSP